MHHHLPCPAVGAGGAYCCMALRAAMFHQPLALRALTVDANSKPACIWIASWASDIMRTLIALHLGGRGRSDDGVRGGLCIKPAFTPTANPPPSLRPKTIQRHGSPAVDPPGAFHRSAVCGEHGAAEVSSEVSCSERFALTDQGLLRVEPLAQGPVGGRTPPAHHWRYAMAFALRPDTVYRHVIAGSINSVRRRMRSVMGPPTADCSDLGFTSPSNGIHRIKTKYQRLTARAHANGSRCVDHAPPKPLTHRHPDPDDGSRFAWPRDKAVLPTCSSLSASLHRRSGASAEHLPSARNLGQGWLALRLYRGPFCGARTTRAWGRKRKS